MRLLGPCEPKSCQNIIKHLQQPASLPTDQQGRLLQMSYDDLQAGEAA
jgi:hypothetical protein